MDSGTYPSETALFPHFAANLPIQLKSVIPKPSIVIPLLVLLYFSFRYNPFSLVLNFNLHPDNENRFVGQSSLTTNVC